MANPAPQPCSSSGGAAIEVVDGLNGSECHLRTNSLGTAGILDLQTENMQLV